MPLHGVVHDQSFALPADHLKQEHICTGIPAQCYRTCSTCCCYGNTNKPKQPNSKDMKELEVSTLHKTNQHSVTYNGPVTNFVYNYTSTLDSSQRDARTPNSFSLGTTSDSSRTKYIHDEVGPQFPLSLSPGNSTPESHSPPGPFHPQHKSAQTSPTSQLPCSQHLQHRHSTTNCQESSATPSTSSSTQNQEPSIDLASKSEDPKDDALSNFGDSLFDVMPYSLFRRYYRHEVKETVAIVLVVFFLYQGLAVVLMTICENGGFHTVFRCKDNCYDELVHRLVVFALKMLLRVITPLFCTFHLPTLASKPQIPATGFTMEEATQRLLRVHDVFTSEEELMEVRERLPQVFKLTGEMIKRRIKMMWISLLHPALFIILLLYLGPFFVCEANTMNGGVCSFLNSTIVTIPVINRNFHFMILLESFSIFIILLLIGVTKDCYSYENRIATFAIIVGGKGKDVYDQIRRRWVLMDSFCYFMPLVLFTITLFSISTGRTFTPKPAHALEAGELTNWYFWICILTILVLLGTSANRTAKRACICSYIISVAFIYAIRVETVHISFGSIIVLIFAFLSALVFNFIYSLCNCHYHHLLQTKSVASLGFLLFCVLCMCVLLLSLVTTIYREMVHFARFVI